MGAWFGGLSGCNCAKDHGLPVIFGENIIWMTRRSCWCGELLFENRGGCCIVSLAGILFISEVYVADYDVLITFSCGFYSFIYEFPLIYSNEWRIFERYDVLFINIFLLITLLIFLVYYSPLDRKKKLLTVNMLLIFRCILCLWTAKNLDRNIFELSLESRLETAK